MHILTLLYTCARREGGGGGWRGVSLGDYEQQWCAQKALNLQECALLGNNLSEGRAHSYAIAWGWGGGGLSAGRALDIVSSSGVHRMC